MYLSYVKDDTTADNTIIGSASLLLLCLRRTAEVSAVMALQDINAYFLHRDRDREQET